METMFCIKIIFGSRGIIGDRRIRDEEIRANGWPVIFNDKKKREEVLAKFYRVPSNKPYVVGAYCFYRQISASNIFEIRFW